MADHYVAIQHADAKRVGEAVLAYADAYGVTGYLVPAGDEEADSVDVTVYPAVGGWTVLGWPYSPFNAGFSAARELTGTLRTVASAVCTYEHALWIHVLFADGEEVDRFANLPDYFTDDPGEIAANRLLWAGNPAAIAEATGVPVAEIAPYLVHLTDDQYRHGARPAHPDDAHTLDDVEVVVELWRRLGITFPQQPNEPGGVMFDAGWEDRLPDGNTWGL